MGSITVDSGPHGVVCELDASDAEGSVRTPRRGELAGVSLVLLGIGVNGCTLAPLGDDGGLSTWSAVLWVFAFQLPVVLLGAAVLGREATGRLPRWLGGALLFVSISVPLAVAELALVGIAPWPGLHPAPRAFAGEHANRPSRQFVVDDDTGWRMRANTTFRWQIDGQWSHYRANAQGFRSDVDFDADEPAHRVVIVGDSFAFGTGVELEETFASLLDTRLGDGVVVRNLAMPGFGLDQMWMSVRHQALAMQPLLVVVAFIDEDLDRSLTAYRHVEGFGKPTFELEDGALRQRTPGDAPHPALSFLEHHSVLWSASRHLVRRIGHHVPIGDWWSRNAAIFRAILDEGRRAGAPILFVRLPSKSWRAFPSLNALMAEENAHWLDLGSPASRPGHAIHFADDGHIDAAGHAFVAEALLAWMEAELPGSDRSGID